MLACSGNLIIMIYNLGKSPVVKTKKPGTAKSLQSKRESNIACAKIIVNIVMALSCGNTLKS